MANGCGYRILDRFSLIAEGREVPVRGQKQRAILAWFCLTGSPTIPRDRLADLLWSDSDAEKARGSLRNTLHVLARDSAPLVLLEGDRQHIRAHFTPCTCEVMRALVQWDAADTAPLAALSLSDAETRFAADLWGLDPGFDQFLIERRTAWLAQITQGLQTRLAAASGRPEARVLAERLRELTPQDEQATRSLMQLEIAAGNKAAALDHYRRLWEVLDEDFDVEPSSETQALAVSLKLSGTASASTLPQIEERITIFLHPFSLAGLSEEDQIVISAVQAEISAALFAVEDWVTIEAGPDLLPPARVGNYELRGRLSPGLEDMRLILTLKDLGSGAILWTWPLQLHRDDWVRNSGFAVQRMAMRLTGRLEAHYISGIESYSDTELADYRKLIRARWLMRDWSPDADRRAEALLRSVASGGDLGLRARVGLAELLNSRELIFPGIGPVHAGVPEALEIGRTITAEAPERGDAWLAFGWSSILLDDMQSAAHAASVVADLSQCNPRRLSGAAEMMALSGDVARAARLATAAAQLDSGVCRVSMGYRTPVALLSGQYDLAMELADKSQGTIPFTYAYGAAAAVMARKPREAEEFWARFCRDLSARWRGNRAPDPLRWFLSASSMRRGHGLDLVAEALETLEDQRQDRVV